MISKYRYEQNKKKYQNLVEHTINHPNIEEDIKKEILKIMEKYRLAIGWMEVEDVKELVEKCVIEGTSNPLKKELHYIGVGVGNSKRIEESLYNNDRYSTTHDKEDDCYNLD